MDIFWQSYLEKLTNANEYINNELFIHQTMYPQNNVFKYKKLLGPNNKGISLNLLRLTPLRIASWEWEKLETVFK